MLISGNNGNGVEIIAQSVGKVVVPSNGNVIQNAYIGTDLTGSTVLANTSDGILISGSTNTSVGAQYANHVDDTTNNTLNVISGNAGNGVEITDSSTGSQVINSYIGVTFTNVITSGKSNGNGKDGVLISDAQNNVVGAGSGARDVISGNAGNGVHITGSSTGNSVLNSNIGTDPTGTFSNQSLQNAGDGVAIDNGATLNIIGGLGSTVSGSSSVTIAGFSANVISGNKSYGIGIASGGNLVVANTIGADLIGNTPIPNLQDGIILTSAGNSIGATTSAPALGTTHMTTGGNLIAGNQGYGLSVYNVPTGNHIVANSIGSTTANGAFNQAGGILLADSADQIIGGSPPNPDLSPGNDPGRNLIEGNGGPGVLIYDTGTSSSIGGNTIEGNLISQQF